MTATPKRLDYATPQPAGRLRAWQKCAAGGAAALAVLLLVSFLPNRVISNVVELVRILVWPAVVLVALALLGPELGDLVRRIREFEGPGSVKVSLDAAAVEEIVREGRAKDESAEAVARKIVERAIVLDPREARIIRALFDDEGRAMYNYQTGYYRPALNSLLEKGYVHRVDRGFALTGEGHRVARDYLVSALERIQQSSANEPSVIPR